MVEQDPFLLIAYYPSLRPLILSFLPHYSLNFSSSLYISHFISSPSTQQLPDVTVLWFVGSHNTIPVSRSSLLFILHVEVIPLARGLNA